ncbi:MAG: hypothetical protein IT305_06445 [Chloroflexi bacterium]|nr:hypothetical protein [Chloroflexota bacterium]
MENDRGTEETWTDWESGGRGTQIGVFVGLAVGAGLLLFLLRRIFAPKPTPVEVVSDSLAEQAAALFGAEPLAAGRELLGEKFLPEMKPVLRALLHEVETSVAQGFKRAERAIDDL